MENGARKKRISIIMISTDSKIFEEGSQVRSRMADYASVLDELHIVVMCKIKHPQPHEIAPNCFAYSTESLSKATYVWGAYRVAHHLAQKSISQGNTVILDTQDPFETGLAGFLVALQKNLKMRVQVHTDFLSPFFTKVFALNKVRVLLAKIILRRAYRIRAVSKRIKNSLVESWQCMTPIDVLPIYSSPKVITSTQSVPWSGTWKRVIFTASRFTKEKNLIGMIELFDKARARGGMNDVGLVIVGNGPERSLITTEIEKRNLAGSILLVDWVDTVQALLPHAELYLTTAFYEGYGLSIIEAVQAHLPVMTTDVGLVGDVIQKSNLMVLPTDTKADIGFDLEKSAYMLNAFFTDPTQRILGQQRASNALRDLVDISKSDYLMRYRDALIRNT